MGVTDRGLRAWKRRPPSLRQRRDLILLAHIREQHRLCLGSYGRPRMTEELKALGLQVGQRRVGRLMRQNNITVVRTRKFKRTTDSHHTFNIAPNLLKQDFSASAPNQKWAGDITYVWTREGWVYLAVILDLYSRRVIGWATGDRLKQDLALRALNMALALRKPPPGCIQHTDRGSQYCAHEYQKLLLKHQLLPSMSGKGNCFDNSAVESFFKSLKAELIWRRHWQTRRDIEIAIFEYINGFYNPRRRHSTLGWKSPVAFEKKPLKMRDRPEHNRCKSIATRFFSQVEPPPRFIRKLKEPPLNRTNIFFGESHSDWLPVRGGESGDFVFRRGDGHAFAKIAPASRRGELAGERDRLIWLKGRGVACPEVINWQEEQEGACLVITAIPGVPAADLSGADLLKAWPSMGQQLGAVHSLSVDQCPFERRLSRMFGRAVDVVSRNAVNPDFLPDEDKSTPQLDLLARVERELPVRLDQERTDMVVCHGDPCMPNFMVDPKTLQCTGLIDLGRLGTADRYADLALMIANAEENWAAPDEAERAFAVLFNVLGIEAPDRERLAFYLRLDPLTWG